MPMRRWTSFPRAPFGGRLLIALVTVAALAVGLGAWGFAQLESGRGDALDDIYRALQLLTLNATVDGGEVPWQLQIARFLAPLAGAAAVLQGILLLLRDAFDGLRARTARNHVVVAGLGRYGVRLSQAFAARGDRVVAVERDPLSPALPAVRGVGVAVLADDAATQEGLRRARIDRARHLVVTCGDDATNVDVAFSACALERRHGVLTTHVHLDGLRLWPRLKARALTIRTSGHRLEFFNVHDTAARILLDRHPPFGRLDESEPHVVLVGMDGMAEMLLLHLARHWRLWPPRRGPLRVTVLGGNAKARVERLQRTHQALGELLAPEILASEVEDPALHGGTAFGRRQPTAVYVCMAAEPEAAAAGIAVAQRLPPGASPVVVVVPEERAGLLAALQRGPGALPGLVTFGVFDNALPPELLLRGTNEILARAQHEQYSQAERARGVTPDENPSLVPWAELPESLKASNRAFADRIGRKLEASGWSIAPDPLINPASIPCAFAADELEALAKMEHDGWCQALLRDGWRRGGPVKDSERKLHPLLVPWDELPEGERDKDREAVAAIPRMLGEAGFRLFRGPGPDG
jgi:hypothetical protein